MVQDARRALNALRVQELKSLCKECGLAISGRKFDLIERLVEHKAQCQVAAGGALDRNPRQARATSHAAHPGALGQGPPQAAPRQTLSISRSPRVAAGRAAQTPPSAARQQARPALSGARINKAARVVSDIGAGDRAAGSPAASRPIRCSQCLMVFDLQHLAYTKSAETFWCPPCRFKVMDPLNTVVEPSGLLKVVLVTQPRIDFLLDLPELRQWRRDGYGIECRMVSADSSKVSQVWPQSMSFCANNHEVFGIRPPEEGHKRRDVPQCISAGLKHGTNTISVRVADDALRIPSLVLAIVLTRHREVADLCSQVLRSKESDAKQRVVSLLTKQRQSSGGDEELTCLSNDKLRLQCPVTMGRIEDPVRGEQCQHLQCFSLEAYIISNRQIRAFNNRWVCPVCSLVIRPLDLVRDEYVARVLRETAEEVEEVTVNGDGVWRVPPQSEVRVPHDSPSDAVDLDDGGNASPSAAKRRRTDFSEETIGGTPSVLTAPAPDAATGARMPIVMLSIESDDEQRP